MNRRDFLKGTAAAAIATTCPIVQNLKPPTYTPPLVDVDADGAAAVDAIIEVEHNWTPFARAYNGGTTLFEEHIIERYQRYLQEDT